MDATCAPEGDNVGWQCGAVAGQSLMHARLHVVVRFRQEPLAGPSIRALLKSDAKRRERRFAPGRNGPDD